MRRTPNSKDREIVDSANGVKYQILEEVGQGAYGRVFSAIDKNKGNQVAIKQIPLQKLSADKVLEIREEVKLLETLRNRYIVSYLGSVENDKYLNIITEYAESGSLSDMLKRLGNKMEEKLVAKCIAQVLKGLQFLHDQGVIHRDVKGANLLMNKHGDVKLADFGVATKSEGEKVTGVAGTPYWMAPEIIEMREQSAACDIWSVGATALELLTGAPPYYHMLPMAAMYRIVQDPHPPIDGLNLSEACQEFLLYCFNKYPSRRPAASKLLKHIWIKRHTAEEEEKDDKKEGEEEEGEPGSGSEGGSWDEGSSDSGGSHGSESSTAVPLSQYAEEEGDGFDLGDDEIPMMIGEDEESLGDDDEGSGTDGSDPFAKFEDELDVDVDNKERLRQDTKNLLLGITVNSELKDITTMTEKLRMLFAEDVHTVCDQICLFGIIPILEALDNPEKDAKLLILDLVYFIVAEKLAKKNATVKNTNQADNQLSIDDDESEGEVENDLSGDEEDQEKSEVDSKRKKVLTALCQFGLIPKVGNFANSEFKDIRDKSMLFLKEFCHPSHSNRLLRRMFLASGGIKLLVELLDPNRFKREEDRETIFSTIDCMMMVMESPRHPKKDFCRLFTQHNLLRHLVIVLRQCARDDDDEVKRYAEKCANLFQMFAQYGKNDQIVQKELLRKIVLKRILTIVHEHVDDKERMLNDETVQKTLLNVLKTILHLSMAHAAGLIENNAISFIAPYLNPAFPQKLQYQCIMSLFYMLRVDPRARQQASKQGNVIPMLQKRLRDAKPGDATTPIVADMLMFFPNKAHHDTLLQLKKHNGVDFYLWMIEQSNREALLGNRASSKANWQEAGLAALAAWIGATDHNDRTVKFRVELVICQPNNVTTLILAFKCPFEQRYFANILNNLQNLCRSSTRLCNILASSDLFLTTLNEYLLKKLEETRESAGEQKESAFVLRRLLDYAGLLLNSVKNNRQQQFGRILSGTLEKLHKEFHQTRNLIARQAENLQATIRPLFIGS